MWDVRYAMSNTVNRLLLTAYRLLFNDFRDLRYSMAAISWQCVAIRSEAEQQAWQ
jgi:hypothetical protein